MNSSIGGPGGPDITRFSARLGTLAGNLSSGPSPPSVPTAPSALSPAVITLLHSLQRRHHAREHLKATHFILAD